MIIKEIFLEKIALLLQRQPISTGLTANQADKKWITCLTTILGARIWLFVRSS
jgi:hypothetical protein